ncbi:MAG TPA: aminotransferase class I/II-fold pyridoxal phosphate-dependent enzyme [Candidatus Tumulicola sp.]|jgi:aspartate/methionine/tyrosine aminotransferase
MPTAFVRFELERLLSTWENRVEYNLSESGVQPLSATELLGNAAALDELGAMPLNYPHSSGSAILRERIAALYPGAGPENVLVTVGAIQANFTALAALTQPGDAVAVMQPNYQQLWGLAQNLDRRLSTFGLTRELDWRLDTASLERAVTPATTLVAIVNPNNPTGRILTAGERAAIVAAAASAGAWLLADEVYAGTEHAGHAMTPTFYGEYERVLAVNSTSKAYGLPGLRIGWIVGPADTIERLWAWQDYVTISTTMLGNALAAHALSPEVRPRLVARARDYVRRGFENVVRWAAGRDDVELLAPEAAAVCLVSYRQSIDSSALAMRLIEEQSTLIAPGDCFGIGRCLRVSFGLSDDYVNEGLRRIGAVLDRLSA